MSQLEMLAYTDRNGNKKIAVRLPSKRTLIFADQVVFDVTTASVTDNGSVESALKEMADALGQE